MASESPSQSHAATQSHEPARPVRSDAPPPNLVTVDADQLSALIEESIRAVLAQRNVEISAPGRTAEQVIRELAKNAAGNVAMNDVYETGEVAA